LHGQRGGIREAIRNDLIGSTSSVSIIWPYRGLRMPKPSA
jgi:hypothetical protein